MDLRQQHWGLSPPGGAITTRRFPFIFLSNRYCFSEETFREGITPNTVALRKKEVNLIPITIYNYLK